MAWEARTQCDCGAYHAHYIPRRERTLMIRCAFCERVTEQRVYDLSGEPVTPDLHLTWPYTGVELHAG